MKGLTYILFVLVIYSCGESEKNEKIIPRQQFVSLLIQMHLIDAEISFNQMLEQNAVDKSYASYKKLFSDFKTDSTTVAGTFDYYADKQDELKAIYVEVLDSLTARANKTLKTK